MPLIHLHSQLSDKYTPGVNNYVGSLFISFRPTEADLYIGPFLASWRRNTALVPCDFKKLQLFLVLAWIGALHGPSWEVEWPCRERDSCCYTPTKFWQPTIHHSLVLAILHVLTNMRFCWAFVLELPRRQAIKVGWQAEKLLPALQVCHRTPNFIQVR